MQAAAADLLTVRRPKCPGAHVQPHPGQAHPTALQLRQGLAREMQSRRRRGHGSTAAGIVGGIDGLVTQPILRGQFPITRILEIPLDVRRQRHDAPLPGRLPRIIMAAHQYFPATQRGGHFQENADRALIALVGCGQDLEAQPGAQPPRRTSHGQPGSVVSLGLDQQQFHPAPGVGAAGEQSGRHDPAVIDHQQVAGIQERGQDGELFLTDDAAGGINEQHPGP